MQIITDTWLAPNFVAVSHFEMTHLPPISFCMLSQQVIVFLQIVVFFCNLHAICIRSSLQTPTTLSMSDSRRLHELDASWLDAVFKLSIF